MKIQPLDLSVIKNLRSDVSFNSVSHCVEELVWNSIDAAANCIAVRLNLAFYKIQVIDNGNGIPKDQLDLVGKRYATSKCHTLDDLQNLQFAGFRGEALSSLKEVSSNLMIESRSSGSSDTYCKIFNRGKSCRPTISINSRPSKGTTVTVFDFMYNRPVRKNNISEALDIEETRKLLLSIALTHPNISFSLQSEATNEVYLQFRKCTSMFYAFVQLFGKEKARNLKQVEHKIEDFQLNGHISTDSFSSKDYQFLFVNKRLTLRTRLNKLISNLLNKFICGKQKTKMSVANSSPMQNLMTSKNQSQHAAFVLNISCPRNEYDVIFDRKRTMVEFSDWDKVLKLVEDSVISFLIKEQLFSDSPGQNCDMVAESSFAPEKNALFLNLGVDNFKNGLFSHAAKRPDNELTLKEKPESIAANGDEDILASEIKNSNNQFSNILDSIPQDSKMAHASSMADRSRNSFDSKIEYEVLNCNYSDRAFICLKDSSDSASILDSLKQEDEHILKCSMKSKSEVVSTPVSLNSKLDIPSRSLFPTQNPVMLRAPVRSALSLLEKKGARSDALLKLSEKYLFVPQNKLLKVPHRMSERVSKCNGDNHKSSSELPKEISCEQLNSKLRPHPSIDKCKSSNKIESRITEVKKSQTSSVLDKNDCRITSKYIFKEESSPSVLKRFCRSNAKISRSPVPPQRTSVSIEINSVDKFNVSEIQKTSTILNMNANLEKAKDLFDVSRNHHPEVFKHRNSYTNTDFLTPQGTKNRPDKLPLLSVIMEYHESNSIGTSDALCKTLQPNTSQSEDSDLFISTFKTLHHKANSSAIPNSKIKVKDSSQLQCFIPASVCTSSDQNIKSLVYNLTEFNTEASSLKKLYTSNDLIIPKTYSSLKQPCSQQFISSTVRSTRDDTKTALSAEELSNTSSNVDICETITTYTTSYASKEIQNVEYFDGFQPDNSDSEHELTSKEENDKPLLLKDLLSIESTNSSPIDITSSRGSCSTCPQCNSTDSETVIYPRISYQCQSEVETNAITIDDYENSNDKSYSANSTPSLSQISALSNQETNIDIRQISTLKLNKPFCDFIAIEKQSKEHSCPSASCSSEIVACTKVVNHAMEELALFGEHSISSLTSSTNDINALNLMTYDCIIKNADTVVNPINGKMSLSELEECQFKSINYSIATNVNSDTLVKDPKPDELSDGILNIDSECNPLLNEVETVTVPLGTVTVSDPKIFFNSQTNSSEIPPVSEDTGDCKSCVSNSPSVVPVPNRTDQNRWICEENEKTKRLVYIDSVTGNSTYYPPETLNKMESVPKDLESNQGASKKTHFFLTHDFSPFVMDAEKSMNTTDDEICDLQIDLNKHVEHQESKDWHRKWRYPAKGGDNIQDMFHNWKNPMFDVPSEVNSVGDPRVSFCLPPMHILNSCHFTKNSLDSLKVIGQVDCKFIACIVQDFNENYKNTRLLALFDQHAVHERIRLEDLTEDLCEPHIQGKRIVRSLPVSPPLNVSLEPAEIRLLHTYHVALQDVGIHLSFEDDTNTVQVSSLPSCLFDKDSKQLRKKVLNTVVIIEKIIKEWLTSLIQSRAVTSMLPKTLCAVLNSQACRGAVKFGDPLDVSQCKQLMVSLSKCKLPFQCAHGRPSIAPILDLDKIATFGKRRNRPQLWKLNENALQEISRLSFARH